MSDTPNDITPRHSDMMIKVCGMCDAANIAQVSALAPTFMGFIFYPRSPRYAGGLAPSVVAALPKTIRPVGVFVNETNSTVQTICKDYGIEIAQLHGAESPAQCKDLKAMGLTVFKAIGIDRHTRWDDLRPYCEAIDLFLFDTKTTLYGGSGAKFDWQLLDDYPLPTPYLLSGGISADDVDNVVAAMRPMMAGVDLNSKFETEPGIKDISKLTQFILSLRKFNEDESITVPFWEKSK